MSQEPRTYTLVHPLTIASRTVTSMTFRPPRGKDIMEIGNPYDLVTGEADVTVMGAMMGRLASLEAIWIEQLSITDWNGCAMAVAGFLEAPGAIS